MSRESCEDLDEPCAEGLAVGVCCELVQGEPAPTAAVECRWVPFAKLRDYAFPKANRTVLDALLATQPSA